MRSARPSRLAKLLGAGVSAVFFAFLALAVVLLTAAPLARIWSEGSAGWVWGLRVPVATAAAEGVVTTVAGPARIEVERLRAELEMPLGALPWWLVGVLWMHAAVMFGLTLIFLNDLRTILRRVGAGTPFDETNGLRMRRLGLVLLVGALFNSIAEFVTALLLQDGLAAIGMNAPSLPRFNPGMILAALVLVVLAETFRLGAELEYERSLVI